MKELSVFLDESGTQEGKAVFCVVTYVLYDWVFINRDSAYRTFRLAQVADYLCAIEFMTAKLEHHREMPTDVKFFGGVGLLKENWLKQARGKLLG